MSSAFIVYNFKIGNTLVDATSCVLSDSTAAYGVKRNDTGAVVVADNTAMTHASTGVYTYTFTTPATGLVYTYAVEVVYNGVTYREIATLADGATGYCTLTEVKSELGETRTDYDVMLQGMITQAKVYIDDHCDRKFDTITESRYFDGHNPLRIDDIASTTGVLIYLDEDGDGTYATTLAATDYLLQPYNSFPKTRVIPSPNSTIGGFTSVSMGVKITATWGYPSVPEPVKRANLIQAMRWFKRKDTAFADVLGNPEMGTVTVYKGLDPDIKESLHAYLRGIA